MPKTAFDPELIFRLLQQKFPDAQMRINEPMSRHTTFAVGGPVRAMFFPKREEEAAELIEILDKEGVETLVLGNGSNLLCSDGVMDIAVVKMRGLDEVSLQSDSGMRSGAGALMRTAAQFAADRGLAGMEFAHGIPGSVGGGAFMNAGAYDGQMSGIIKSVRVLSPDGTVRDLPASELDYSYRHSRFEESGEVILSVLFGLTEGDTREINGKMRELWARRTEKQPLDKPSAGSTFKRPKNGYAAAMIDGAGLKGFGFGGAAVSEKHAGFVINRGGATCEDVLMTMRGVREKVFEKYGVLLEPEVRLIGVEL